jgi:hypothetical protein
MAVHDQYIVGMGGAVALNQVAIHAAMDLYEIQDKRACFEKVVLVGREVLKSERDEKESS